MLELLLVPLLLAVGALPLFPVVLAQPSRSRRAAIRVPAKIVSFALMYACFVVTAGGVVAAFIMAFERLGDYVILGAVVAFLLVGAWLSYYVIFL